MAYSKDHYAERFLRGHGWDDTWDEDAIIEDIERLCRLRGARGTLDVDRALRFWRALRARRYPTTLIHSSVQHDDDDPFLPAQAPVDDAPF